MPTITMNHHNKGSANGVPVIYVVTSQEFLSHPHTDDTLLLEALQAKGYVARLVAWSDSSIHWQQADLVLIRSTWDYCQNHQKFMNWSTRIAGLTNLWNPVEIVQWNSDKRYLPQLSAAGLPTIPTLMLDDGHLQDLESLCRRWHTRQIVIKPVIGSNSYATFFVKSPISPSDKQAIHEAAKTNVLFAQPYLPAVETYGERSLVFIDGQFVHAFRKTPFYAFLHQDDGKEKEQPVYPSKRELALAMDIMQRLKHRLLFGRIDLLNDENSQPRVMELEFIEPRLNLHYSDRSLDLLVEAIGHRLSVLPSRL